MDIRFSIWEVDTSGEEPLRVYRSPLRLLPILQ